MNRPPIGAAEPDGLPAPLPLAPAAAAPPPFGSENHNHRTDEWGLRLLRVWHHCFTPTPQLRHYDDVTDVTMGWISARGRMQVRSGDCHRWDEVRWSETLSLSVLRSHAAPMTSSPAQQTVENTSIITYYITVTSSGLHQSGTNWRHCIRQVGRKRKESRHHHQTRRHDDWKHATGSRCKVGLKCGHAHPWDKMSLFHLYLKAHSASKVSTAPFPCSWSQWVNEAMLEQINSPPILQFLYRPVEAAVSQSLHC